MNKNKKHIHTYINGKHTRGNVRSLIDKGVYHLSGPDGKPFTGTMRRGDDRRDPRVIGGCGRYPYYTQRGAALSQGVTGRFGTVRYYWWESICCSD